jgi:hypothetical protein
MLVHKNLKEISIIDLRQERDDIEKYMNENYDKNNLNCMDQETLLPLLQYRTDVCIEIVERITK